MKTHKELFKWIVCLILVILCVKFSILSHFSLTPLKAHQKSERTLYYGPSQITEVVDINNGKIYLCRYKDWISASTVKKNFIFWSIGNQSCANKIDYKEKVNFTWFYSNKEPLFKLYGIVNDDNITSIELTNSHYKNLSFKKEVNSENMFIFCLEGEDAKLISNNSKTTFLAGKNTDGKVILYHNIWDIIIGDYY